MDGVGAPLLALVVVLSFSVGTLMGMIGGGGGFVYVLLLVIVARQPASAAVGTGLLLATLGAAAAAVDHGRAGTLSWPHARRLLLAGIAGAVVGGAITPLLPERLLLAGIVVLFVALGVQPLLAARRSAERTPRRRQGWQHGVARGLVGGLVGVAVGAFGMSGGTPLAAYLGGVEDVTAAEAVGTAMVVVTAMSLAGAAVHVAVGQVSYAWFGVLAAGAVGGSVVGAGLSRRVDQRALLVVLGCLTLLSTVGLVGRL